MQNTIVSTEKTAVLYGDKYTYANESPGSAATMTAALWRLVVFFEQTKRLNVRRNAQLHVDVTDRLTHRLFYLAVLHVCCYAASYAAHELNWTAVRELEFVFRTKRPSSLSAANHYEVAPGAWTIDAWCN